MKNEKAIKKLDEAIESLQEKKKKLQEPEFKDGWYKSTLNNNFVGYFKNGEAVYGVDYQGRWFSEFDGESRLTTNQPASTEEISAALIAEAKKRGFKEGVKFRCLLNDNDIFFSRFWGSYCYGEFWVYGQKAFNGVYFKYGQWAEIITEPKVTINGEVMQQDGDIISFGCAKFHKEWLKELYYRLSDSNKTNCNGNRTIKSITLDSGVEITIEQLKLICDNIK